MNALTMESSADFFLQEIEKAISKNIKLQDLITWLADFNQLRLIRDKTDEPDYTCLIKDENPIRGILRFRSFSLKAPLPTFRYRMQGPICKAPVLRGWPRHRCRMVNQIPVGGWRFSPLAFDMICQEKLTAQILNWCHYYRNQFAPGMTRGAIPKSLGWKAQFSNDRICMYMYFSPRRNTAMHCIALLIHV
jgi:hypothetical protein